MESLPSSLVAQIFDELTLRDAHNASYVSRQWRATLIPYLREVYNVHQYLSCFPNPESLLQAFRRTGTILSGSKALSYFLPSHRKFTMSSDWDIFVPYPHENLIHKELSSQGFHLTERNKEQRNPEHFLVHDYFNSDGEKVQLVALTSNRNIFDCLMDFHESVVQNFISGWGCFSVHWQSTFDRKGWMAQRLDPYPKYQMDEIEKYDEMGIELVRWGERDAAAYQECNIYAVYLPAKMNGLDHAYITVEELKEELLGLEDKMH
jgi:hypothetical protein